MTVGSDAQYRERWYGLIPDLRAAILRHLFRRRCAVCGAAAHRKRAKSRWFAPVLVDTDSAPFLLPASAGRLLLGRLPAAAADRLVGARPGCWVGARAGTDEPPCLVLNRVRWASRRVR